ncbi:MAG TPA: IS1595 family transposase [Acidimicrobiia bacterium]|jgi:transposase-like protein|nr:IS1595 family transposase [Acidimicrobiia bacterium]
MAQHLSIPALAKRVTDESSAYQFLEELRWGDSPVCPHCDSTVVVFLTPRSGTGTRATRTGAQSPRRVWKCKNRECRKQFSALTGTIFHGSKIPVRSWLFVLFEMCASKNGVSAREVQRKYDLTPKSAWFMTMRIREAMKRNPTATRMVGTIEADEAYIGGKARAARGTLSKDARPSPRIKPEKTPVLTLVNRETGEARTRVMARVTSDNLYSAINHQVNPDGSRLMTDESKLYDNIGNQFTGGHDAVWHAGGEYVRGDVTSNRAENYFSQLKRSLDGTHHRISAEHLDRYLAEFDFRFSTRKLGSGSV